MGSLASVSMEPALPGSNCSEPKPGLDWHLPCTRVPIMAQCPSVILVSELLGSPWAIQAELSSWSLAGLLGHHKGNVARAHFLRNRSILSHLPGGCPDPGIIFQKQPRDDEPTRERKAQ